MRKTIDFIGIITTAFSVASCTTEEPQPSDEHGEDEVGVVRQELGEDACGTLSLAGVTAAHGAVDSSFSTSGDNEWGSTYVHYDVDSTCPYQYVVEYQNLPAFDVNYALKGGASLLGGDASAAGQDVFAGITNELDCERTRLYVGVYVWDSNTTNPSSEHTLHAKGFWNAGGLCVVDDIATTGSAFSTDTGTFAVATGKYKIRIAARAQYCSGSDGCDAALNTNLRVETHLRRVQIPQ